MLYLNYLDLTSVMKKEQSDRDELYCLSIYLQHLARDCNRCYAVDSG
jgi:hypothetical protein